MGKTHLDHKSLRKKWKLKGMQRLAWFCQMCEKQCRGKWLFTFDEHGFKSHCSSESHQRQMALFAENKELFLEKHSTDFHNSFMQMLGSRYKNGMHSAKAIYEDFISDPFHVHLNSTRWTSFTAYVKYLGKEGFAKVEETDGGWMIQYIDRSGILDKQKSAQKKGNEC